MNKENILNGLLCLVVIWSIGFVMALNKVEQNCIEEGKFTVQYRMYNCEILSVNLH